MIHLKVLNQERKLFRQKIKISYSEIAACLAILPLPIDSDFCVQTGLINKTKAIAEKRICFIFAEYLIRLGKIYLRRPSILFIS